MGKDGLNQELKDRITYLETRLMKYIEAAAVLRQYVGVIKIEDDWFEYRIEDKQYISNRSAVVMSEEDYKKLKVLL